MVSRRSLGWMMSGLWVLNGMPLIVCAQVGGDYELKMIANSTTFSQAIAINAKLETLGTREVTEGPVSVMKIFFRSGEKDVDIVPPKEFTNIEPQALSDTGLVVGYVSRPAGNAGGSLRPFVWDSQTQAVTLLEPLPTDIAGHAQDISADGKRITGYSTGNSPPRIRPCVWQWHEDSGKFVPQELSTIVLQNPYLQASQVIISPDGKRIAACITEELVNEFVFDSSLFVWELTDNGDWQRKKLSDEQPKLKDMNDHGVIVGMTSGDLHGRACVINTEGKLELIDLLPGDESNVAHGINNSGIVVGMSDDPHGGEGGPQAFVWQKGVVEPLRLLKGTVDSSAMAINQEGAIAGFMLKDNGGGPDDEAAIIAFIRTAKAE